MTQTPEELTDPPGSAQANAERELLNDVLSMVRLNGAIFLRAEFTAPWAYESSPSGELARLLEPRARRHILFHIIAEGQCWVRLDGGDHLHVSEGEVVVLPYGERHIMGSPEGALPVPVTSLLADPPWNPFPVIRYGGGGARTSVVCGYLWCEDQIFDPIVRALPPLFTVKPPDGPAAAWVAASIQYALDAAEGRQPSTSVTAIRLPELLFSEVLRLHIQNSAPRHTGWLAALRDPVVGPALLQLHAEPAHRWTVEELARRTAYSRSSLTERFSRLLGRAPMKYLSEWRLQVAAGLLRDTRLGVAGVAYRVGYESEEAFSRAFKRAMGRSPAQWRRQAAGV
jgi:AraC-like DNA-binding protein